MKILVIDGHPYEKGLASELARTYCQGALAAGHEVKTVDIRDLKFDPVLKYGYRKIMGLEPDLVATQEKIKWCQHLVIAYPIWWMGFPALLKGFVDRTFLPNFAYTFGSRKIIPKGLLKGRSARIIYTQGAPRWATMLVFFDFHWLLVKFGLLRFCGIWPIRRTAVGNAEKLSKLSKEKLLEKVAKTGKRGK